jgi:hypothetical protein
MSSDTATIDNINELLKITAKGLLPIAHGKDFIS